MVDETPVDITVRIARAAGYDEGYDAGIAEEREAWCRIIGVYNDVTNHHIYTVRHELRDDNTCPCGRCSRCVRAASVARHGGDYTGGPVTPW